MKTDIIELNEDLMKEFDVEEFLFDMIKKCYHMEYVPQYHYDIINLEDYYVTPEKNTLFVAIDSDKRKIIATAAVRKYDKDYHIKGKHYTPQTTASIYRVFVHPDYRRSKLATKMVKKIEEFCKQEGYHEIYLHTQKDSIGALPFWLNNNYKITEVTNDSFGTIHMEKCLI